MAPSARPAQRNVWTIALLIAAFLLAAQVLRLRIAESAVRAGDGATAAAVRPQNGWGAALHAEFLLDSGHVRAAQQASIAALDDTPYAASAVRTLARTLERTHGLREAERAWQIASALGWRDKPTQLWAVLRALSNSEADIFAMRADALLRTAGDNRAMMTVVRHALLKSAVRQAFLARLARRPPWRGPFFDVDAPLRGKDLEGTAIALRGLAGTGAEPSRRELSDTIGGLIAEGRHAEALQLDRMFVRRRPDPGSLIDDGGFELAGTDYLRDITPFDWTLQEATATLDRSGGRRSMAVTTEGSRGGAAVVRHAALDSGTYLLRYQIQGDRDSPASLGISVSCVDSGVVLGRSDPAPLQSSGWQARAFRFSVPAGCALVKIGIESERSDPGVAALFDDVAITRA